MNARPDIHTELEQLPVDVLSRYLEGNLSPEEVSAVEAFLEENPMYADALEGLKSLPDPASARLATHDLRHRARRMLSKRRPGRIKQFNFVQYATAAVAVLVVLFVATTALFFNSTPESKASMEETVQAAPKPTVHDEKSPVEMAVIAGDSASDGESDKPTTEVFTDARTSAGSATSPGNNFNQEVGNAAAPKTQSIPVEIKVDNKPSLSPEKEKAYENAMTRDEYEQKRRQAEERARNEAEAQERSREDNAKLLAEAAAKNQKDMATEEEAADEFDDGIGGYDYDNADTAKGRVANATPTDAAQSGAYTQVQIDPAETTSDITLSSVEIAAGKPSRSQKKAERERQKADRARKKEMQMESPVSQGPGFMPIPADSIQPTLDIAIGQYNQGQYKQALNSLQLILATDPDHYQAQYYMGNSYQNMSLPEQSLPYLQNVVAAPDSVFFEPARWNLANAFLQADRKKAAKKLLREIAGEPGAYQQNAEEVLERIK